MESIMNLLPTREPLQPRGMRSRLARTIAAVVGVSLLLAACAPAGGGKNSLTLWYTPYEPTATAANAWEKYHVDPFKKLYPEVTVKAVQVNGETSTQKLQVALAAGTGPDIITAAGPTNTIPYAQAGYLQDLTAVSEKFGWKDRMLPWAYEMGFVDGKLVSLPSEYETLLLYYNKTLFEQNGWQPPTDRASLLALVDQMNAKGIIPFSAGNADYSAATEWFVSAYLDMVGGPKNVHAALQGDIPWTDPKIVNAIQTMKDDFDAGWFAGGVKQYFTNGFSANYTNLADGKAAMMISGSWDLGGLGEVFGVDGNTNEWDWVPLPAMGPDSTPGMFPLSIGSSFSVNAKAADIEVADNYLDWFFSATADQMFDVDGTVLPVKFDISQIPAETDERQARTYISIGEASEKGNVGYTTWTSLGAKAEAVVVDDMNKVLNGDLSVAEFCAELDAAYQEDAASGLMPQLFSTGG
jgi:raffinose/stachyose/melibiose transport system substrate-binding protein